MKILLISNLYPEPIEYGITPDTKAIHYFAKEWVALGHEVLVLHPYWNPISKINRLFSRENYGIKEYEIDGVSVIFKESQIFLPHKNTVSSFQQNYTGRKILQYLKQHYSSFVADIVVVHFPCLAPTFNKNFLKKKRAFCTLHGVDLRTLFSCTTDERKKIVTYLNNSYKSIFFRSKVLREQGRALGLSVNEQSIVMSGIDSSLIADTNSILSKLQNDSNTIRLIYAGKINKQKRIDTVIKALAVIKNKINFHFTILGDGPEFRNLTVLCSSLGLSDRIEFIGKKSRQEVSNYMRNSDVFLMLSKGETLGLVYLEAMGQGCLAIGSKGEGIDGVIKDGCNGFLCTPENVDELSNLLLKIASLPKEQFNKITFEGYQTVVNMTSFDMANRYLKMCEI